jgi:CheY-like chemotaxis protein
MPYKRRLWGEAPRELREDVRRFRVQIGAQIGAQISVHGTPESTSPDDGPEPVVLVVDDDEAMRSLVACYAEHLGYRTISAGGAEEALAVCASEHVDVVITDALMPKMDGRELCHQLKSTPQGATIAVVLMTSVYKARAYRNEAISRFRVDTVLSKPLDFDALAQTLYGYAPLQRLSAESRRM